MFENNAIFWVEIEKIKPNPFQPRREFDEARLRDLADSIRQYGVLQPIVISRIEREKPEGGFAVEYELIAGERRLRASRIAGITQIPAIIRDGPANDRVKLELAIIENLQREDLNPIDRAHAFAQLANEFGLLHADIARKIGKSRVYVTNTIRLLSLPEEIVAAVREKKITEGHTRPLLMLAGREEQATLFRDIMLRQMTVRDAEGIARRIAVDRAKKKGFLSPEMRALERSLSEKFGTRVQIESRGSFGGKVVIDYFSSDDLQNIIKLLKQQEGDGATALLVSEGVAADRIASSAPAAERASDVTGGDALAANPEDAVTAAEDAPDAHLYAVRNFTV